MTTANNEQIVHSQQKLATPFAFFVSLETIGEKVKFKEKMTPDN